MEKFNRVLRGYDPVEVNDFLDDVIKKVENMVEEMHEKDREIEKLKRFEIENNRLKDKTGQYEKMEDTVNKALIMAQKTSEQLKLSAHQESQMMIEEARKNANRIVNEALLKAEKAQDEATMLRRNVNIFKRRLRELVEAQLQMVDDMDKVDF